MRIMKSWMLLAALMLGLAAPAARAEDYRVAFMPDVHFHDVHGQFTGTGFAGVPNPAGGPPVTIRTMAAQLSSTRLFNENAFAFRAALDDAVRRGVRLIVLNGDFSDDGQPVHLRGLRQVLAEYETRHGLRFFLTNGNHDPVRPREMPAGKPDFMGPDGAPQAVYSPGTPPCPIGGKPEAGTICTPDIASAGYDTILRDFADYGFAPRPGDLYWETPFYQPALPFDPTLASAYAGVEKRQYRFCGTRSDCRLIPDASYLVEPVAGLWLLAIDANLYEPLPGGGFEGSGGAGFNRMEELKPHLLPWIADVVKRAKAQGKVLLAFSHFPAIDTNNGASDDLAHLFGGDALQLSRMPDVKVARALSKAGLRLHVGGHMHYNDTARWQGVDGSFLVNVQAPSLAAYVPAYKLLTLSAGTVEVETPRLTNVPGFDSLFPLYRREWQRLRAAGADAWDIRMLDSRDYAGFTRWHLTQLARRRFLPQDWPADLRDALLSADAAGLRRMAGLSPAPGGNWTGLDLAVDLHRLLSAGSLALPDIPEERRQDYRRLLADLTAAPSPGLVPAALRVRLALLLDIVGRLQAGLPDAHFRIDLTNGAITPLP